MNPQKPLLIIKVFLSRFVPLKMPTHYTYYGSESPGCVALLRRIFTLGMTSRCTANALCVIATSTFIATSAAMTKIFDCWKPEATQLGCSHLLYWLMMRCVAWLRSSLAAYTNPPYFRLRSTTYSLPATSES
ncbi:hypothetical protein BD410DRAFT_158124 [Rickenella mellea]|uniref:Uncharacterized protein n=1 Tax=Rickenella mellea TaxID=50990 RepID=A0A4Y7Q752_9AGAM|nr:hypothetical protein BD410DRAFT_158124 [Rickenella mellea]